MKNKKLLFTGGGGVFSETIWMNLRNKYDIYFAGIDWGATFDLFPIVEISYDAEFQELTKNED